VPSAPHSGVVTNAVLFAVFSLLPRVAGYYYKAHACIMVFDVTRKVTYTNLANWCVMQWQTLPWLVNCVLKQRQLR